MIWSAPAKAAPLLAALVLTAAGCGGSDRPRAAGGGSATTAATPTTAAATSAPPAAGPFRWLVRTVGEPPSVADENRSPGTTAWRLPGPSANVGGLAHGPIGAYVAAQALAPGELERVYVSDRRARSVRIRVFRMGWYGGTGGREVLRSQSLRMRRQPPCRHDRHTGLTQCGWHPALSFAIPAALPSGVYIAKLSTNSGDQTDTLFVVSSKQPTPLLAQLPTATYEAYNSWGGDSLYPGGLRVGVTGTTQGVEVSYDRPYDSATGAGQFFTRGDVSMVRFLEHYGYPVSYTDSEAADRNPGALAAHRALLDFGHSEYWSERQLDGWRRARDAGTSLAFLGSDTLGWRVRYAPAGAASSEAGQHAHVIVSYKEHAALDPDRRRPTGLFSGYGAPLSGSAYLGCITPRVRLPGAPTYRYYGWQPDSSLRPAWLFAGTHMRASTVIPGITGYELDQVTARSPAGVIVVGHGSAPCMASRDAGEPYAGPGPHSADATLYTARSGALVFNTGTLGWELGLGPVPSASPDAPSAPDPRVVRMTRNVLDRMLGR